MKRKTIIKYLPVFIVVLVCACTEQFYSDVEIVAGGPDKFMEVRHITISGSNEEIGKEIGRIAKEDGLIPQPTKNTDLNRSKRAYLQTNYPLYYERMKGVAAEFGLTVEDDHYDFTSLFQKQFRPFGCSVVYYPGNYTESGHGILSRNFDLTTGDMTMQVPDDREMALLSRPIIFELYPDEGYASLSVMAFDYLGGTLGGVNSEGLAVAILEDGESPSIAGRNPENRPGFHELMSMRYLLDNCSNTEEAAEALKSMDHYYILVPCHYMVADRDGNSFVFDISPDRESFHIAEGEGPQCVTNHLLYLHPDGSEMPDGSTFSRYRKLHTAVDGKEKFTEEEITRINRDVFSPPVAVKPPFAPGRTLWHSLYDTKEPCMKISFYLGETADQDDAEKVNLEYSDYLEFKLK